MRRVIAAVAALVFVVTVAQPAAAANLLTNAGFEAGTLSGWTCSSASVSTSAHTGSYALAGNAPRPTTRSARRRCR